jgi:hypothetical protein
MFTWEIEEKKRLSKRDLLLSTKSACLPPQRDPPSTKHRRARSVIIEIELHLNAA